MAKAEERRMANAPTIQEFMKTFRSDKDAAKFIIKHIFPCGEIVCPHCGCTEIIYEYDRIQTYSCGHCRRPITIFNGTVFEGILPYFKDYLYVIYSMFTARKSVSTLQLHRETNRSFDTLLKVRRRIQAAMANYDLEPFSGVIQMDEVYLGGSNHGRYSRINEGIGQNKFPVFGIYDESKRRVYSYPAIPDKNGKCLSKDAIKPFIEKTCKPGSTIVSDEWRSYNFLDKNTSGYHHERVNHKEGQYTNANGFTTNLIEGYWGLIKKTYYSTHAFFSKEWAHLYLAESDFRYNYPDWEDAIETVLRQSVLFPQVIDIRCMGRFANRTYDLKDYRMILPKCFDDIDLEDITALDIVTCAEPVYGILKESYKTRKQRHYGDNDYPDDWQALGFVKGGTGYKDYRNKKTNTLDDIKDMIKDATRHRDVNSYTAVENKMPKKRPELGQERARWVRKKYETLPTMLQVQIKEEYPNIFETTKKGKTGDICRRMSQLLNWYDENLHMFEMS